MGVFVLSCIVLYCMLAGDRDDAIDRAVAGTSREGDEVTALETS